MVHQRKNFKNIAEKIMNDIEICWFCNIIFKNDKYCGN